MTKLLQKGTVEISVLISILALAGGFSAYILNRVNNVEDSEIETKTNVKNIERRLDKIDENQIKIIDLLSSSKTSGVTITKGY